VGTRNDAFHEGLLAGVVLGPLKLAFGLGLLLLAVLLIAWCVDCTSSKALGKLSTELAETRVRPASVVSVGIQ
jgi:hypothetical protein